MGLGRSSDDDIFYSSCMMTVITSHPVDSSLPVFDEKHPETAIANVMKSDDDSSRNSRTEEVVKLVKAWEQPGIWGTTRRVQRTIQRYIWGEYPASLNIFLLWVKTRAETSLILKLSITVLNTLAPTPQKHPKEVY